MTCLFGDGHPEITGSFHISFLKVQDVVSPLVFVGFVYLLLNISGISFYVLFHNQV